MKQIKLKILIGLVAILGLTSCLKKDDMNIDPDGTTGTVVVLQFIENGSGTTINSGLQYFSGGALTYPADHLADTADFNVNIAGPSTLTKDVKVTIGVKSSAVLDYYGVDSIKYELMPDSLYDFISTTATIKAGSRVAPFKVIFYPSKINPTKSYMLPVVVTDAEGQTISSNFGIVYFHVIGNPIAGAYLWDFYRYNNQDGSGSPSTTWTDEPIVFSPVNPTSVKVPTGYYVQPNYLISFKNSGGVLSDFTAVIAPDEIKAAFTDNGINIVSGPNITVTPDLKKFTIKYTVYNGSAYRNITDIFHR